MIRKLLSVLTILLLLAVFVPEAFGDGYVVGTRLRKGSVDVGDLAPGGFKVAYAFSTPDLAANLSFATLNIAGANIEGAYNIIEYAMPWSGHIVGVSICSTATVTGGIASADVTINGVCVLLTADIDQWVDTRSGTATQIRTRDTFDAGDRLGVKVTTDNSFSPTTADISVVVIVGQ